MRRDPNALEVLRIEREAGPRPPLGGGSSGGWTGRASAQWEVHVDSEEQVASSTKRRRATTARDVLSPRPHNPEKRTSPRNARSTLVVHQVPRRT